MSTKPAPIIAPAPGRLKLVAYCRVSTEEQKSNSSLETQFADIKSYCSLFDYELVQVISEVETGYSMSERPKFREALKMLRDGLVGGVIVWKLDRFARNLAEGSVIFSGFQKNGWELISVRDQIDTTTPMGKAFFHMSLVFAELERNSIVDRTTRGRQAKVDAGLYAGGRPSYGYKMKDGKLVPVRDEQDVIKLAALKREEGFTLQQIADYLNSLSLPTKLGGKWSSEQVRRVLNGSKQPCLQS